MSLTTVAPTRWTPAAARNRIAYQPRPDQLQPAPRDPLPRAVTLLAPGERALFDAAVRGACEAAHLDAPDALGAALRQHADGVVVSATVLAAAGPRAMAAVADAARSLANTPLVVLVSGDVAPAVFVALGRIGARAVVDVRGAQGWAPLQALWASAGGRSLARRAGDALATPLADATPAMRQFVLGMFDLSPRVRTVRGYAPRFGLGAPTLMSRFFRAGLPTPRRYLALARLARAAQLFENPRCTVGTVAAELEHSSAQAFSRHLYLQLGIRPLEFRRTYDAGGMLGRFADELLVPYRATLATFVPF